MIHAAQKELAALESLRLDYSEACREAGGLAYFFLEGSDSDFPESPFAWLLGGHHEFLEVFPQGDHRCAHTLVGSPTAIARFKELAQRSLPYVPTRFQRYPLRASTNATAAWLSAILAFDWYLGVKKHGGRVIWCKCLTPDGADDRRACTFLPCNTELSEDVLIPIGLEDGIKGNCGTLLSAIRSRTIHDVFGAGEESVGFLSIRRTMPPYFDNLKPTYTEMIKLVWEIEDLVAAARNAGLIKGADGPTLGSAGDCGFMLAACGIRRYLYLFGKPIEEHQISATGWNWSVFEALMHLLAVMQRIFSIQGWDKNNQISISHDRAAIPKLDFELIDDLSNISAILRHDGLEVLSKDAVSLGTAHLVTAEHRPRVFADDIDSFSSIKLVRPCDIAHHLDEHGFLAIPEDIVQRALEQILDVPIHKNDWGGEDNDLYTTNLVLGGKRVAAAFCLNGKGKSRRSLHLKNCGHNGDQITRLFRTHADIYVLQFVGNIEEDVVTELEDKAMYRHLLRGERVAYCAINGQDTARLLHAYGLL